MTKVIRDLSVLVNVSVFSCLVNLQFKFLFIYLFIFY